MRVAVSSAAQKHGAFNTNVGLMLEKCHKQWPNIKLALCQPVYSIFNNTPPILET